MGMIITRAVIRQDNGKNNCKCLIFTNSSFLAIKLYSKHSNVVVICKYTRISTRVKSGDGGIWDLITPIIPINAIIKVAMFPILSAKAGLWKNTAKFITPNNTNGIKIVASDTPGNL